MNLERCMLPGQRPSDWIPSTPIDILPALRIRYPNCIDDSVSGVQLVNRPVGGHSDWQFVVVRDCFDTQAPAMPVTEDRGDGYDFSDWPIEEYPGDVLQTVLQTNRIVALQNTLGIFKPAAFDMMRRIQEDARETEEDWLKHEHLSRIRFFRSVATHLSEQIASSVDLVAPTVEHLKAEDSFGLRAEEGEPRWMEIGAEAATPSLLYQRTLEDVESTVSEVFSALPRHLQVALWYTSVVEGELFSDKSALDWDAPSGSFENWALRDMDAYINKTARRVMAIAENDHWNAQ